MMGKDEFLLGMKTPVIEGDEKWVPYFELVQRTASEQGKIFFLDTGQARDFETDDMYGEDLSGWLIDKDKAEVFVPQWIQGWDAIDDAFFDDFVFAKWHLDDGAVSVEFKRTRYTCWRVPEKRKGKTYTWENK